MSEVYVVLEEYLGLGTMVIGVYTSEPKAIKVAEEYGSHCWYTKAMIDSENPDEDAK